MKKKLNVILTIIAIVIVIVVGAVCTYKALNKDDNSNPVTNVTIGNTKDIEDYENDKDKENEENKNKKVNYEEKKFDGFTYSTFTNRTNEIEEEEGKVCYNDYCFHTKYDEGYTKEDRLQLKNISENISQALFYGDTYKDKDETLKYVLSFVYDDDLKQRVEIMFKSKWCEMVGAVYTDDEIKYNTDKIYTSESHKDKLPFIGTSWNIHYTRYDKYGEKVEDDSSYFHLTFIKEDDKWKLTKIETE